MCVNVRLKSPTCTIIIGAPCAPPGPKDFASGDRVKVDLDMDVLTSAMQGSGAGDGMVDQLLEVVNETLGKVLLTSLVPRPPPRFYLAAMEKNLHGCEIKSGWRPWNEASYSLCVCNHTCLVSVKIIQTNYYCLP